jgi:hypothetical protein
MPIIQQVYFQQRLISLQNHSRHLNALLIYNEGEYLIRYKINNVSKLNSLKSGRPCFCFLISKLLTICKSCFLDFVNRLHFNNIRLRLAQPGGPTARVSVLPFYLKTEEDPASET